MHSRRSCDPAPRLVKPIAVRAPSATSLAAIDCSKRGSVTKTVPLSAPWPPSASTPPVAPPIGESCARGAPWAVPTSMPTLGPPSLVRREVTKGSTTSAGTGGATFNRLALVANSKDDANVSVLAADCRFMPTTNHVVVMHDVEHCIVTCS